MSNIDPSTTSSSNPDPLTFHTQNPLTNDGMTCGKVEQDIPPLVPVKRNEAPLPRFFLTENKVKGEDPTTEYVDGAYYSISAIALGMHPYFPTYVVYDVDKAGQDRLGVGKLTWKNIPIYIPNDGSEELPSHPPIPPEFRNFENLPYDNEEDMRGPNPSGVPAPSMLDVDDGPNETPEPKLKRAKCTFAIDSPKRHKTGTSILIEQRRLKSYSETAFLSKRKLHKGWKVHLDHGRKWKIERGEEGVLLWKDHQGISIAEEIKSSQLPGLQIAVELRVLYELDEYAMDFLIAVWIARVADESGTFERTK